MNRSRLQSLLSVFALTVVSSTSIVLLLAYGYGFSVSATYNSYVAFGLSFVEQPSHKNVVYLQLMSGLGSTFAPFISSLIVDVNRFNGECPTILLCHIVYRGDFPGRLSRAPSQDYRAAVGCAYLIAIGLIIICTAPRTFACPSTNRNS